MNIKKSNYGLIFLTIVAIFVLTGCKILLDDANGHYAGDGVLRVINESGFSVWLSVENEESFNLNDNESVDYFWDLNSGEIIKIYLNYGVVGGDKITVLLEVMAGQLTTYSILKDNGLLQINNESAREIWYTLDNGSENYLSGNNYDEWVYELLDFEEIFVDINYSGYHVFSNYSSRKVIGGTSMSFDIIADGGGIKIENNIPSSNITAVYLSPSDSQEWGSDDLYGNIPPGDYVFWTIAAGYWDILVVDEFGSEYISYDNSIDLDNTSIFYVDGWKKTTNKHINIKSKLVYKDLKTKDKVEFKEIKSGNY